MVFGLSMILSENRFPLFGIMHGEKRVRKIFVAGVAAVVALFSTQAWPQTFPGQQPIRIIVPFAAGGNVDVTARAVAPDMSAILGQTAVVENRPGAGGMIGAGAVMSSKPDGHTLLMGSNSTLSVGPNLQKNWPYDPVKGITPITNIHFVPFVLVVRTESDIRSVADLVQRAKARPGEITQAHAGIGSSNHLVSEFFQMLTGAKFLLVPYKGGGPAMNDLLGGQVQSYFDQASTSVPQIKAGKIRALAVAAARRMPALPDVPTFKESLGIDGFEILNVTGLVGPAGMDPAVVARVREATVKALENPSVKQLFETLGVQIQASTPEQFADFIRQDLARWERVIKEANVQIN
jgi:tripartite-type tricarboxylate transporter receptor subunit TctC